LSLARVPFRSIMGDLGDRLRALWLSRARPSLARLRSIMADLGDRLRTLWLSRAQPWLARLRQAIVARVDRFSKLPLSRVGSTFAVAQRVGEAVARPFTTLRWRLRRTRLGRSADGIIVVPVLLIALVLGVFAATAATNASSPTVVPSATTPASSSLETSGEVVTETIMRKGKPVRIIRYKDKRGRTVVETVSGQSVTVPGNSVTVRGGAVTLPGDTSTVHETRTQTVTNTVTETEVVVSTETQVVTTTVVEPPPDG
jgi:hypothetical protein